MVEDVEQPLAHEPGDREERPVVEELVEQFALAGVLATVLEPLPARVDEIDTAGHGSATRAALIGVDDGPRLVVPA